MINIDEIISSFKLRIESNRKSSFERNEYCAKFVWKSNFAEKKNRKKHERKKLIAKSKSKKNENDKMNEKIEKIEKIEMIATTAIK